METIKVNMNPNPLDVQTIHASQNDGEARQWEFELHNNGELIDTSEITEQMFFKAYKGGTEQLLPENTSTPTTSPFKGDIRYPQGLLSDQEFTYRQSPTEEDGLTKITDIKGNTLTWNQLVQNGNFADTSKWSQNGSGTFTVNNNEATILTNITGGGLYNIIDDYVPNHKYLYSIELKGETSHSVVIGLIPRTSVTITTSWAKYIGIIQPTNQTNNFAIYDPRSSERDNVYARNVQLIDLTKMGLDSITDPNDFTSLFPLSYYAYNQGSLLSFNGNGIKTVGKNLVSTSFWEQGSFSGSTGEKTTAMSRIRFKHQVRLFANKTYSFSMASNYRIYIYRYDLSGNYLGYYPNAWSNPLVYTPTQDELLNVCMKYADDSLINPSNASSADFQMEISSAPTSYEPYTESVLSLPISTYFPNGMKSAYNSSSLTDIVRDELSQTKATKKVKQITYDGSSDENWRLENISSGSASGQHNFYISVYPAKQQSFAMNNMAVPYALYTTNYIDGKINAWVSSGQNLNFYPGTDITSVADFRTWLSNHPLTVNIALPTDGYEETEFTTASLVTENAEIPLSNEDGILIGKCTEQLSSESGFFDAKIKLSDSDGECYSNKIQLHVERSPQ